MRIYPSKSAAVTPVAAVLLVLALLSASCIPGLSRLTPNAGPIESGSQGRDNFDQAWEYIFQDYVDESKLDPEKLSQAAIRGMLQALDDPYTSYLDPSTFSAETQQLRGNYEGIGAYVGSKEGRVIIISVVPGSPAEKAGVQGGDIIAEIDGESTEGFSVTDVTDRIRGPTGTTVQILMQRGDQQVSFSITRAKIQLTTVSWEMKGDIAYVRIIHFSETTAREFDTASQEVLDEQAKGKVKGMILDLRSNPGGLLDAVVDVASHFVSNGVVLYVVDREGKRTEVAANPGKKLIETPVMILVDEFSASGSEVLSGALRDRGVASVAGRKTFGKGSVNIFRPLPDGGALYITTSRWLTPNGTVIEGQGLQPDYDSELHGDDLVNWAIDNLHQQSTPSSRLPVLMGA